MDLIWTLVIGGVIGWLASILMGANHQMGIIANVIVGIIGSWAGQEVFRAVGGRASTQLGHWLVAIGGAVLLIVVLRSLGVFRRLSAATR